MTNPRDEFRVLDWVEGDASTFTPYRREVPPAVSPAELARAKWLPVLKQPMTRIEVCYAPAPVVDREEPHTSRAHGQEVACDHPSFLTVIEAVPTIGAESSQEERISYIPWENIVAITFYRPKRDG